MEIITSKWYEGFNGMRFRYHVDDNGVWWYSYEDLINYVGMRWKYANEIYNHDIEYYNKNMFEDYNNNSDAFIQNELKFVTTEIVKRLIKEHNEINKKWNMLGKAIMNLECKTEARQFNDLVELETNINLLNKYADSNNLIEMANQVDKLYHMDSIQNVLDKTKGEIVDETNEQRQELIDAYDEGRLIEYTIENKLNKIEHIKYKRHIGPSSCPNWLKSLIK